MKSVDVQDRFVALTEKLKELFVGMAGPIMDVVSPLMDLVSTIATPIAWISEKLGSWGASISEVLGPLGGLGKILKGIAMLAVAYAAYSAFASLSAIPVIGPVLGLAAAASITAVGTSFIGSIKDGVIDPKKGPIVSGEFGSVQLHPNDQIVAGTNLFPQDNSKSTNNFHQTNSDNGNITLLTSTLGNKMDIMINKLDSLIGAVNKGMVVNLDGNKVSQELLTPLAIANRRT